MRMIFCSIYSLLSLFSVVNSHVNITQHPSWMLLDHDKCGVSSTDRIIGGKNATMGTYPWLARIGYRDKTIKNNSTANATKLSYRCGGTLVNKMYVVTAAHCVVNLSDRYELGGVRLGEHNTQTNPDCEKNHCASPVQDFGITQTIAHRKYNVPMFRNDIAVIRLDRAVTYNAWVMPLCLPRGELLRKNFTGEKAEVAGWGIYDINQPKESVLLQRIKLPIVSTDICKKKFKLNTVIGDEQMCVGGEIGADSCGGDSGGPLMKVEAVDSSPPKYYFIGIVSFGAKRCGEFPTPAVYTKVSEYIVWILDNISP